MFTKGYQQYLKYLKDTNNKNQLNLVSPKLIIQLYYKKIIESDNTINYYLYISDEYLYIQHYNIGIDAKQLGALMIFDQIFQLNMTDINHRTYFTTTKKYYFIKQIKNLNISEIIKDNHRCLNPSGIYDQVELFLKNYCNIQFIEFSEEIQQCKYNINSYDIQLLINSNMSNIYKMLHNLNTENIILKEKIRQNEIELHYIKSINKEKIVKYNYQDIKNRNKKLNQEFKRVYKLISKNIGFNLINE